jgi:hypothetical protein
MTTTTTTTIVRLVRREEGGWKGAYMTWLRAAIAQYRHVTTWWRW